MKIVKWIISIIIVIILGISLVFLSNFSLNNSHKVEQSKNKGTNKKTPIIANNNNNSFYKTVINNGKYLMAKSSGITILNDPNTIAVKSFQNGLINFSKEHFSTKNYIFSEGQYLTTSTANKWLNRKSAQNTLGLNPVNNNKTGDQRNPIYLQSIQEQDFSIQNGNSLQLKGIVLGLAMNSENSYYKKQYGPLFKQNISVSNRIAYAHKIVPEIISRYRSMNGISQNIPIYVALFTQSSNDAPNGGNYYSWTKSENGNQIDSYNPINQKNISLPINNTNQNNKNIGTTINNSFTNLQNKVENFFPNISTMIGTAQYNNNNLTGLTITISTQATSSTEIESFSNYVANQAAEYLPNTPNIQIKIENNNGLQSLLVKKTNTSKYNINIIN